MPVIRIDDEVWKELQKRAIPLIDTPNSVLRKLLGLEDAKMDDNDQDNGETKEKAVEIRVNNIDAKRAYAFIPVPKSKRRFFPGFKESFLLETDVQTVETRVTSAPSGTPIGDRDAGAYIQGNLRHWYEKHPELQSGDIFRFEMLEPGKRYRLAVRHNKKSL